eukprot:scaffold361770_cov26-Prasinocladus_malaysianus.AAC.1
MDDTFSSLENFRKSISTRPRLRVVCDRQSPGHRTGEPFGLIGQYRYTSGTANPQLLTVALLVACSFPQNACMLFLRSRSLLVLVHAPESSEFCTGTAISLTAAAIMSVRISRRVQIALRVRGSLLALLRRGEQGGDWSRLRSCWMSG